MSTYSSKKGDIIEKYKKYFDIKYSDREDFFTLRHRLEKVCELKVKKDTSIYKIEFVNKRGKSIHLPYIYPSRKIFKYKFGIDPELIIEEQKNPINIKKQIQTIPKTREMVSEGKSKFKVKSADNAKKEIISEKKSKSENGEKSTTQKGNKKEEKIEPKKEGFIKRTINKWKVEREIKKQREEKDRRNLILGLCGMAGAVIFGTQVWKFYLDYTDEPLVFPEIDDGSLYYNNTALPQTSSETQSQSDNQTESQEQSTTTQR